ncbi:MAG: YihY/virulence factor BrkB family protein [Clostridiales bacterium]|nr:YihY/virulence factor BrkB family protein [Clostridiales bacterium]
MVSVIRDLVDIFFKKKVSRTAAQLAYYLVLSIFPLLICVNAMLGSMNIEEAELMADIKAIIPIAAYESIIDYLGYVSENFSVTMLIMALAVLVTASSAAFRAIITIMAEIQDEYRYIGFWKGVFSVIFSLALLLAVYASCIIIITGNWFIGFVSRYISAGFLAGLWQWLRFVLLFFLLFAIIYGVYKLSAPKTKPHRQRIIGAVAAALTMVAASVFFSWTISLSSRYPIVYGSLASVIILMIWLFICGNILIMGNVFNVVLNRYMDRRRYIKRRNSGDN